MQKPLNKYKPIFNHVQKPIYDPFRLLSTKPNPKSKNQQKVISKINDENRNTSNVEVVRQDVHKTIGLTKRIKKPSIIKKHSYIPSLKSSQISQEIKAPIQLNKITISQKIFDCYPDTILKIPEQFQSLSRQQAQDNDCDSDWDQVQAGATKLFRSLKQRLLQQKTQQFP